MALTVVILGSTQLNAITAPAQDQSAHSEGAPLTPAQQKELMGIQEKYQRGDYNTQQQAPLPQGTSQPTRNKVTMQRESLRISQGLAPSKSTGFRPAMPSPRDLYDLQKSLSEVRGSDRMINAILEAYIRTGKQPPQNLNLNGLGLRAVPAALNHPYYANNVVNLTLVQNKLTSLSGIENLKNLRMLTVGLNQISDISAIQALSNLTFFSAVRNRLTSESMKITLPNTLQTLVLDGNMIGDLPQNRSVDGLRSISLQGNPLTHFCWIRNTRNLQNLRVDNVTFQNVPKTLTDDNCVALAMTKIPKV